MSKSTKAPIQNTHLTDEELNHFRSKLLEEKKSAEKEIRELKNNYDDLTKNSDDTQSAQDHHQGDIGSEESEKSVLLAGIERNNGKLDKINVALDRMDDGNYGICIVTNKPIQKGRLEAISYALQSVEAKR
jgi:RNA polymerase-binding protein DksA